MNQIQSSAKKADVCSVFPAFWGNVHSTEIFVVTEAEPWLKALATELLIVLGKERGVIQIPVKYANQFYSKLLEKTT